MVRIERLANETLKATREDRLLANVTIAEEQASTLDSLLLSLLLLGVHKEREEQCGSLLSFGICAGTRIDSSVVGDLPLSHSFRMEQELQGNQSIFARIVRDIMAQELAFDKVKDLGMFLLDDRDVQ